MHPIALLKGLIHQWQISENPNICMNFRSKINLFTSLNGKLDFLPIQIEGYKVYEKTSSFKNRFIIKNGSRVHNE